MNNIDNFKSIYQRADFLKVFQTPELRAHLPKRFLAIRSFQHFDGKKIINMFHVGCPMMASVPSVLEFEGAEVIDYRFLLMISCGDSMSYK